VGGSSYQQYFYILFTLVLWYNEFITMHSSFVIFTMKHNLKKELRYGFTLIELLVVIAIIGILSSVVLASLNTARNRSTETSIRSQLATIRGQASVYYNLTSSGSFTSTPNGDQCQFPSTGGNPSPDFGMCNGLTGDVAVSNQMRTVAKISGAIAYIGVLPQVWAAWAQLKSTTSGNADFWCVDSAGASKFVDTITPPGAQPPITVCP
jgi:prepilin-type N-terminal cleavage/methylation domain-containing protein